MQPAARRTTRAIRRLAVVALVLAAAGLPAVSVGEPMPDLSLALVATGDGPTADAALSLSQLRGQVIYLDVWASWCGPCRESFPWMQRLHETHGERGLRVVALSVDRDAAAVAAFLERHPVTFSVVHDRDHGAARALAVPAMPTSYLIDREGVLRHVHQGFSHAAEAELERQVEELLR